VEEEQEVVSVDRRLITKRIKQINKRQKRLSEEILKESILIEKLRQEDLSWNTFIRKLTNLQAPEQAVNNKKEYSHLQKV